MRPPDDLRAAPVTLAIAALTAAAWLIAWMGGWQEAAAIGGGFIPARVGLAGDTLPVPALLTPLTATLVHSGFAHLFLNLIILLFCGRSVERVLGGGGIVILYLVGAYARRRRNMRWGRARPCRWSARAEPSRPCSAPSPCCSAATR
jgi:membrane associated rhomboid family serine protease